MRQTYFVYTPEYITSAAPTAAAHDAELLLLLHPVNLRSCSQKQTASVFNPMPPPCSSSSCRSTASPTQSACSTQKHSRCVGCMLLSFPHSWATCASLRMYVSRGPPSVFYHTSSYYFATTTAILLYITGTKTAAVVVPFMTQQYDMAHVLSTETIVVCLRCTLFLPVCAQQRRSLVSLLLVSSLELVGSSFRER